MEADAQHQNLDQSEGLFSYPELNVNDRNFIKAIDKLCIKAEEVPAIIRYCSTNYYPSFLISSYMRIAEIST